MSQHVEPDLFRQKLEESRAAERAKAFPMTFAGFPCRVRPMSRLDFIRAGRMPEHLTKKLIAAVDREPGPPPQFTAAQAVEGEIFMRKAVCVVMVEPAVVEAEPVPDGGYLYADLEESAPALLEAVFQWVMKDCPAPAEEKGEGVLGVEDLERFPDGAGGQSSPDAGDTGAGGGEVAVGADAPDRKRTRRK